MTEQDYAARVRKWVESMHYGPTTDPWQRGWNAAVAAVLRHLDAPAPSEPTGWHRHDCPEIWGYGCACGGNEPRPAR